MSVLSDEQLIEKYSVELNYVYDYSDDYDQAHYAGLRAVAEAAIAADRAQGAEPVAWCWLYDGKPGQPFYGTGPTDDLIKLAAARDNPVTVRYFYPRSQPVAVPDEWRYFLANVVVPQFEAAKQAATNRGATATAKSFSTTIDRARALLAIPDASIAADRALASAMEDTKPQVPSDG